MLSNLNDLYFAQRAGFRKLACYKSLVNTLESLKAPKGAHGNQRQVFNFCWNNYEYEEIGFHP